MAPEIRRVRADEMTAMVDVLTTAFLERPDAAKIAEKLRPLWDLERVWAAFDGSRMCGTFRSWATELTVPGGAQLPAAGVVAVTVLPTHRRRGFLRAMVSEAHGAIRESGEAFGLLYAAEYPIYGRFGYGPGCTAATWTLSTLDTGFHGEPARGVDLEPPSEASRDVIQGVYDACRLRQHGEIRRREFNWDHDLGLREPVWDKPWKGFLIVHRDPGGNADGYARYRAEDKWEQHQPRSVLIVDDLHAGTDDAYAALWRFLADTDLVATVKAEGRSPAERLPWLLTNARAAHVSDVGDGLWVRLFDIPRALEARTYEGEGSVVLDIVDPEAPGGRLRFRLDVEAGGATCRPTDRSPDLTLNVSALGAAYLGGTRLRDAVVPTGADEHTEGALARADALLAIRDEPWCSTSF